MIIDIHLSKDEVVFANFLRNTKFSRQKKTANTAKTPSIIYQKERRSGLEIAIKRSSPKTNKREIIMKTLLVLGMPLAQRLVEFPEWGVDIFGTTEGVLALRV